MDSNPFCNHSSDLQSDLLIICMITTELDDMKSCYQLIKNTKKIEKQTNH